MDITIGLCCRDFVAVAADMSVSRSVMVFKHDEDKIARLDDRQILGCSGDQSSRSQFSDYIEKNFTLMKLQNGKSLSNNAAANFIRNTIAEALRSRGAYQVNSLLGSFDDREGPALYHMDYLGSLQKVEFSAHGYGSYFALSLLDAKHKNDMTPQEGVKLLKECIDQLSKRFLVHLPRFMIKTVTETGIVEEAYLSRYSEV